VGLRICLFWQEKYVILVIEIIVPAIFASLDRQRTQHAPIPQLSMIQHHRCCRVAKKNACQIWTSRKQWRLQNVVKYPMNFLKVLEKLSISKKESAHLVRTRM
jgi:hypothetical protein